MSWSSRCMTSGCDWTIFSEDDDIVEQAALDHAKQYGHVLGDITYRNTKPIVFYHRTPSGGYIDGEGGGPSFIHNCTCGRNHPYPDATCKKPYR